jgi:hypothetical protein
MLIPYDDFAQTCQSLAIFGKSIVKVVNKLLMIKYGCIQLFNKNTDAKI